MCLVIVQCATANMPMLNGIFFKFLSCIHAIIFCVEDKCFAVSRKYMHIQILCKPIFTDKLAAIGFCVDAFT